MSVAALHYLWLDWAEIAVAHEADAKASRERGAWELESVVGALEAELSAALVTISSAAFALEAFKTHVGGLVPSPRGDEESGLNVGTVVPSGGRELGATRFGRSPRHSR